MKFIANSFSPSMTPLPSLVRFSEITLNEFCNAVKNSKTVNAIGHQGTVDVVNSLCESDLKMNRIQIKAQTGDTIYIITLMVRIEEGKVLSGDELKELLAQGKVKFLKAEVFNDVIDDLKRCKGVCGERAYDSIVSIMMGEEE